MKNILIIDDFASVRFYHCHLLSSAGYEVLEASDGQSALRVLETHRVQLILLDVMMPGMDGWEFLQQLRRKQCETPVLIITTESEQAEAKLPLESGRVKILIKPVQTARLLQEVQAWIE